MALSGRTACRYTWLLALGLGLGVAVTVLVLADTADLAPGPQAPAEPRANGNSPLVIVVKGDLLGPGGEPNRSRSEASFRSVCTMLAGLSIPYAVTSDSMIERHGLAGGALAIFPYNRAMSDGEAQAIATFVERGGKVLVCFTGRSDVLGWAGVRLRGWRANPAGRERGELTSLRSLPGLKKAVTWVSPQIARADPLDGSEPVAVWRARAGGDPELAAIAGPFGAFVALLPDPKPDELQARFLRAMMGLVMPSIWPHVIRTDPASVPLPTRFRTLDELTNWIDSAAHATPGPPASALAWTQQALESLRKAQTALAAGDPDAALEMVEEATRQAGEASWASYPSVPGELRGVWMHNCAEPSWEEALAQIEGANLNAVFPYVMSGGVAFYDSAVLPGHRGEPGRDYLREAMSAAQGRTVQVHARMLNLSLLFSSDSTKRSLRAQGRCVVDAGGRQLDWLCPTNEANRRTQIEAARELARYGVAGVQFDYLRYPSATSCVCQSCRKAFERYVGVRVKQWPQDAVNGGYRGRFSLWRRQQVTRLAREMSSAVRAERPDAYVSAAVFPDWERHVVSFGQDWKTWVEEGVVDFVCPMNYTRDATKLSSYLQRQNAWVAGAVPLVCGIGVYADGHQLSGASQLLEQVATARAHHSSGFVIFNYSPALSRDFLPWLARGATSTPTCFDHLPAHQQRRASR